MTLFGLQKMTLLDFPGKVACTVFTGGCNFRCPFCHNARLVTDLSESVRIEDEEIFKFLAGRRGLLDGVCVTGGEPLLLPDIVPFIRRIREMGFAVKLDTNGSFPDRLKKLVAAGLVDYVAMDIKNCKEKYARTVGLENLDLTPVEESVRYLLGGHVDFEFRTTVLKDFHTPADIEALTAWIEGAPRYFLQNFVDSGGLIGEGLSPLSREELNALLAAARRRLPATELRGV